MTHLLPENKPCSTKKEEEILAVVLLQLRCPLPVSKALK